MALGLDSLKSSNKIITLLVFSSVLILLFIPDIVGISSPLLDRKDTFSLEMLNVKDVNSRETRVHDIHGRRDVPEDGEAVDQTALEQEESLQGIQYLVNHGYIDHLVREKEEEVYVGDDARASIRPNVLEERDAREQEAREEFLPTNEVNWSQLKGKTSRRFLQKSLSQVENLYRDIDPTYEESRYALVALASGIRRVMGDLDRSLTAIEAVEFLQHLDMEVTEAMQKDNVPRADFMEWRKISLTPVIGNRKADRVKQGVQRPFNPHLQLVYIEISAVGDSYGRFKRDAKKFAHFTLQVQGEDVKSINHYRNGVLEKSIGIRPKAGTKDTFVSSHHRVDFEGIHTFEVIDKYGSVYRKRYNFSEPSKRFTWVRAAQGNLYYKSLPVEYQGPAMDRYFAVSSDSGQGRQGFFGGPGKAPYQAF